MSLLVWLACSASYAQTRLTDWVNLNCKTAITSICHDAGNLYASTMGGGVSYAQMGNNNTAVSSATVDSRLSVRNNHLLFPVPAEVFVYDTSGCLVLSAQGTDVDLSPLHQGVFIVRATHGASHYATRVVIQ